MTGNVSEQPVVRVRGLRMTYGTHEVLTGVDLDVHCGEVVCLLGPNGAGKSTTIEVLEGFRLPSAGEVRVLGTDPARADDAWRARVGVVLQSWRDHPRWTPRRLLTQLGGYYRPYATPGHPRPYDVDQLLDDSVAELGTAVAELRQIGHGLRPSTLDDGLPAALANLVRSVPLTVDMHVDGRPLPDAVATTAYFVASEAITNAVKHAEASRIVLQVVRRADQLLVRVTDDGIGGARLGLRSGLVDRVAALGGSLHVASPEGRGTQVEATLQCAS